MQKNGAISSLAEDNELEQRTDEWFEARLGMVTASRISEVVGKTSSGSYSSSRANYMTDLILEKLTGKQVEKFSSQAMEWGTEKENDALNVYGFHSSNNVNLCGFIRHNEIEGAGASPDGLVGEEGLVEIKCPNSATHLKTLLNGKIAKKYLLQMQFQMACTGRKWCDFVSYDPRFEGNMTIFIKKVDRDDKLIDGLNKEVLLFINEMDEKIKKLKEL